MGIEEELSARLRSLPVDSRPKTRRAIEGERLVREVRQLFKDIADALTARSIPTETIYMRSPVPSNIFKHFLLGDDSNPLVPGAEGWCIIANWVVDTRGALWTPNGKQGCDGEWQKVDLGWWQDQFTRDNWHGFRPYISQSGHQVSMREQEDGAAWLELLRSQYHTGKPDRSDEIREGLLQATAELIAEYT